jgi:hypothetical protein
LQELFFKFLLLPTAREVQLHPFIAKKQERFKFVAARVRVFIAHGQKAIAVKFPPIGFRGLRFGFLD